MNINSQQLRYFMELAKCLNFTRAAANLYVAQPTLSQQIADLEAQLGVSLFVRTSRSVTLTPAGTILYTAYPDIAAQAQQVHQHMLATAAGFSGSLTIGFLDVFADSVPQIMRSFKNIFPDIDIRPINASLNELNKGLKNHTIDVAFSLLQDLSAEDGPAFKTRVMKHDPMCFVLPAERPFSSDYSFAASDPLIVFGDASGSAYCEHVSSRMEKIGIHVSKVILTESVRNIRAYLESGTGFSILASGHAPSFSANTQFIPVPGEYLDFGALWNPDSANPALPLFLDALDQFLDQDSEPDISGALPV